MRRKIFTIISALLLVLATSVTPMKVAAQGLVEYALILVLVAVGPGEKAEIQWLPQENRGEPQTPVIPLGTTQSFTIVVTNTGDATCNQTISSEVGVKAGLNTIHIARNAEFILFGGAEVELNEECLWDPNRVSIAVGVPFPPGFSEQRDSDPKALQIMMKKVQIVSWSIVASNSATVATGRGVIQFGGGIALYD